MRITEGQLRKIIREELSRVSIREGIEAYAGDPRVQAAAKMLRAHSAELAELLADELGVDTMSMSEGPDGRIEKIVAARLIELLGSGVRGAGVALSHGAMAGAAGVITGMLPDMGLSPVEAIAAAALAMNVGGTMIGFGAKARDAAKSERLGILSQYKQR